ncbi:Endonuclease/exonuclease/phosphatase [Bombardia bombarda]|uniref:Endonuclease/exonuclease/phosphatase n=1 Tax=Bombardia bombarda TaxID=252184 RepID=A0AA40C873_9PEZI|nr:Endonuclease/exonuclease/phosphatase [Bombardia bombarda]
MGPRTNSPESTTTSTMMPSTLDLFILTFNCAKNLIDPAVFAPHLQAALSENATSLPDLVVFSLQETAPISYAFIGSYFLDPYYARFEEALNLASVKALAAWPRQDGGNEADLSGQIQTAGSQGEGRAPYPYTLVRAKNVGMTAILLFARRPAAVHHIEEAECGFGAADMGNKGAVGLRVTWSDGSKQPEDGQEDAVELARTTELTFVATHLAAMEWNLQKRNANWRTIASSLTFANPKGLLPGVFPPDQSAPMPDRAGSGVPAATSADDSSSDIEEDGQPLLPPTDDDEHRATLQDISIFKPTSHLFIAGDLNYRISTKTPPPLATLPSLDAGDDNHFSTFLPLDQLTQERIAGRTFHGMSEAPIKFAPTYKYNVLPDAAGAMNEAAVHAGSEVNGVSEVPWRFASHRWPGWCDRVLFMPVPGWVEGEMDVRAYNALPVVRSSDHRAVFLRVGVPVVGADGMRLPSSGVDGRGEGEEWKKDPRVSPPVAVDVHAWERRAAARRREIVVGWTAFVWSTQMGALVLATLLAVGVGSWWLYRLW